MGIFFAFTIRMNNLWCKIFIFLNLLFIVDIITPSRASADDNKIENEQLWTWPKDTFFKKSEINQNTELMKYLQSEKIDFFFNGLFPETFLIKKSSSENIYRNILKNIFTNLNKSATAEYLIRLNQIDNYNTYFVFTEDLNFWLNSWSDVVRKKIFIFINPNTFNEKSLIKYLAHEIAIISDQKIKFIKKELFLTQKILNIENLDSNDFYPMYTFSIITNPILHSVFSMIRANKFENIVFDEINELKTSDFFNKKNL